MPIYYFSFHDDYHAVTDILDISPRFLRYFVLYRHAALFHYAYRVSPSSRYFACRCTYFFFSA